MTGFRTYKRKLKLTTEQTERIERWMGVCRMVYNMGMEIKNTAYAAKGVNVHEYELMKQLKDIRADHDWVRDVPVQCQEVTLTRLANAYKNFFRGFGYPKFASKKMLSSLGFKQVGGILRVAKNGFNLPKIGIVKMFKDSKIVGIVKTATIRKEPTGYFICIQCSEVPSRFASENQAVGLDMGLSNFCIDSNGNFITNPRHFKKYERRLRVENRSLARKKKGSNSWKKQCKKLSRLHHKIKNARKDFLHKESTAIAKRYSSVYMEDLNVSGMIKNGNLSKHVIDASWGSFRIMLEYKTGVICVNPKHTSQTCSQCGRVDSESRKSQSNFTCTNCSHSENADVNAAKNILRKGIALDRKSEPIGCALVLNPIKECQNKQ